MCKFKSQLITALVICVYGVLMSPFITDRRHRCNAFKFQQPFIESLHVRATTHDLIDVFQKRYSRIHQADKAVFYRGAPDVSFKNHNGSFEMSRSLSESLLVLIQLPEFE